MLYDNAYTDYFQNLYDTGTALKFSNAKNDTTWAFVDENSFLPDMERNRHSNSYPCRYKLASHPKDCPPHESPDYKQYWINLVETGVKIHRYDVVTALPRRVNCAEISVLPDYTVYFKAPIGPSVSNTNLTSIFEVATEISEHSCTHSTCCSSEPTPPQNLKETPMSTEKITIEIDAKCIKTPKAVKELTAFEKKHTLLVKYYSQSGSLYSSKEFSGKRALKKAKDLLRDPAYAGCTMVPYHIGKMVRVKIDLEEV